MIEQQAAWIASCSIGGRRGQPAALCGRRRRSRLRPSSCTALAYEHALGADTAHLGRTALGAPPARLCGGPSEGRGPSYFEWAQAPCPAALQEAGSRCDLRWLPRLVDVRGHGREATTSKHPAAAATATRRARRSSRQELTDCQFPRSSELGRELHDPRRSAPISRAATSSTRGRRGPLAPRAASGPSFPAASGCTRTRGFHDVEASRRSPRGVPSWWHRGGGAT